MNKPNDRGQNTDQASLGVDVGVAFTLTVHMADGTSKDIQCVGHITGVEKEQDDGNLRS